MVKQYLPYPNGNATYACAGRNMNALLKHKWGQCVSADWGWSRVAGMRPAEAVLQPLMALQAFVDETENGQWREIGIEEDIAVLGMIDDVDELLGE